MRVTRCGRKPKSGGAWPRSSRACSATCSSRRPTPLRGTASSFEFNRFAAAEGVDAPRQVAYGLSENHGKFQFQYLDSALAWRDAWPAAAGDPPLPHALRVRLVLASGEELVRVFAFRQ